MTQHEIRGLARAGVFVLGSAVLTALLFAMSAALMNSAYRHSDAVKWISIVGYLAAMFFTLDGTRRVSRWACDRIEMTPPRRVRGRA